MDLRPLSTLSSAQSLPSGRAQGETGTQDLEEQRRTAALAIADLILVLWPRHRMADLLTTHSTPSKAIKQRTKLATQLKSAIATLWSSQSLFQERTRLVLDIYQVKKILQVHRSGSFAVQRVPARVQSYAYIVLRCILTHNSNRILLNLNARTASGRFVAVT